MNNFEEKLDEALDMAGSGVSVLRGAYTIEDRETGYIVLDVGSVPVDAGWTQCRIVLRDDLTVNDVNSGEVWSFLSADNKTIIFRREEPSDDEYNSADPVVIGTGVWHIWRTFNEFMARRA